MIPNVILVGTGVVGRAILKAHIDANVSVQIADLDESSLTGAVESLRLDPTRWKIQSSTLFDDTVPAKVLTCDQADAVASAPTILVESIAEKLDIKRSFFEQAERCLADQNPILCSNTSTLRITQCGDALEHPQRLCGMHFFMPVYNRPAVEVVKTPSTDQQTIDSVNQHVRRIGKSPIVVPDSPGFIVNRLLSPYLNEGLLLLSRGISADRIEQAALRFGMPMSPLELIDWIGTRTMFDAGRAIWQAFPNRFDPSPILGGLIKAKRMGRACGMGVYDYADNHRSDAIAAKTAELAVRYQRNTIELSDDDVMRVLSIPMWIEAALARQQKVASSLDQLDMAMRGGLGYQNSQSWPGFFDSIGGEQIIATIDSLGPTTKSLTAPASLKTLLSSGLAPSAAIEEFAHLDPAP